MKASFSESSDPDPNVTSEQSECSSCKSSLRIKDGLCAGCLLQVALESGNGFSVESFFGLLEEIPLRDENLRLGSYEILEEIGRGGMGVIYRARQRHSRRIVALKRVLSYHSDSRETLVRFRREAQAAATLDHPNILPIYEVSETDDGLPFFTMKFAEGGSLQNVSHRFMEEGNAGQIARLIAKVARAVHYAHERGILHRDLKPGNILLDAHQEPLVSDFGLAKWLDSDSDLTRTLTIYGTAGYIAPEQASEQAAQLKPSADVYSLGAILFDLLTGRPPFLGSHALSVIRQAMETAAPKLRSLSRLADRDLETICARCLEREPSARYQSANDLADDLERWLEGRPIIARPVSIPVRFWRWSRRNPTLTAALGAIFLLVCFATVGAIANSRLSSILKESALARRSIVIQPIEDLSDLSTLSSAAQSATHDLLSELSRSSGIQIKSTPPNARNMVDPWHVEDWKRIGETANARFVLSGSVREREGKHRIAIHLIETVTGSVQNTWLIDGESQSFLSKRAATHVSDLFNDKSLAATLGKPSTLNKGNLAATGESKDSVARSYFERGKEFFLRYNLPDLDRAIDSFRKALTIDSEYAQAHAMLATACQLRSIVDPEGPWLDNAQTAAATALRLAPMLSEAHAAAAGNLLYRRKIRASLDEYLTAYELDPSNGRAAARLGNAFHLVGRPDLSILWYKRATSRETRPVYADNIGDAWTDLGDYDEAVKAYNTASIFRPDLPTGNLGLSRVALLRGDYDTARAECSKAQAKYKGNPQPLMMAAQIEFFSRNFAAAQRLYWEAARSNRSGGLTFYGAVRFLSAMGYVEQQNAEGEGEALLRESLALDQQELAAVPDNSPSLYNLAADYAALNDVEAAIAALDKAIDAGWVDHRSMSLDPRFDSIRSQSEFRNRITKLTNLMNSFHERAQGEHNDNIARK